VAAAVALGNSLALVWSHLQGIALPGCGPGSPCEQAAAGPWGHVPIVNWPLSHLGMAYFAGVLVAWLNSRGALPALLRWTVRVGVLGSLVLTTVLIVERQPCTYCLAVHAANILFWLAVERGGRRTVKSAAQAWVPALTTFVLFTAALGVAEWQRWEHRQARGTALLREDEENIIAATSQRVAASQAADAGTLVVATGPGEDGSGAAEEHGFTGRWRWGPEAAPIRLVLLTDYQCVDCNAVERQILPLFDRPDVSISVKHFPMCTDCNSGLQRTLHKNACVAAQAAEAAGILGGNDGFWRMHHWLFDHQGTFTTDELTAAARDFGHDAQVFWATMRGAEVRRRIEADVEEGRGLGLHFTPMVFINGVEVRGWYGKPDAIVRAVERVAATNPPALTAANDHPVDATIKYIQDWRESPERRFLPRDSHAWQRGPADAKVSIVMWGDYQEPFTAQADAVIQAFLTTHPDAQYTFRHYPVQKECNPATQVSRHPLACRASAAAEAAGAIGGQDAYWRMHDWLLANQEGFSDERLRQVVTEWGWDVGAFFAAMDSDATTEAIREDALAGKTLGLRSIPFVYVNNRWVPRWLREGDNVLERVLDEAAGGR